MAAKRNDRSSASLDEMLERNRSELDDLLNASGRDFSRQPEPRAGPDGPKSDGPKSDGPRSDGPAESPPVQAPQSPPQSSGSASKPPTPRPPAAAPPPSAPPAAPPSAGSSPADGADGKVSGSADGVAFSVRLDAGD